MPRTNLFTFRRSVLAVIATTLGWINQPVFAQLEEVIITARKREQGLQDVPIAVEAFSAKQITKLSAQDIGDLGAFTPNVTISRAANQPEYFIRGMGTDDFGIGADPAVGVYQDGVYSGRAGGSKVAFNDLARVEILNGPQGTLFGRNAAAGAIQYISHKPDGELYGWARATVGNYDRYQLDGVASDSDLSEKRNLWAAVYHLTYDMDWATLTSISSYRYFNSKNPEEKDGSAELYYFFNDLNKEKNDSFGQELRPDGSGNYDPDGRLGFLQSDQDWSKWTPRVVLE